MNPFPPFITQVSETIMSEQLREQIENLVNAHHDPCLGTTLGAAQVVRDISVDQGKVAIALELGFPARNYGPKLAAALKPPIEALDGVENVTVDVEQNIPANRIQDGVERMGSIKNIIAIASGKGGVGKSTVAANLALALSVEGASVGVLDADIYGPSQPRMLGVNGKPRSPDGKRIIPMESHGVQSMSIGYLIGQEEPTVWRGPMVSKGMQQLLNDTEWGELDYLIVDMPPGTGDIQLTLSQRVPVSGSVIVTTPQDIATLDARKGLQMFRKVDIPILGIVENMSLYTCSNCGHEDHIFGEGGGSAVADSYGVSLLGQLPLDINIREAADGGEPSVISDPDGDAARHFRDAALRMSARQSVEAKQYDQKMPTITVEDT